MKLKQLPEDFIVEEQVSFKFVDEAVGGYKVYLLEKKSIDTFSALDIISRANGVSRNKIGIAGLKDKHALTKQYISVPKDCDLKYDNSASSKDAFVANQKTAAVKSSIKLTFCGFIEKPISIGDLDENKFTITIRALVSEDQAKYKERVERIKQNGVPNYFDSQRFGSLINGEFIGKCLVKKDYEKAVKIYLTEYGKNEKSEVKQEKKLIADNWHELSKIANDLNYSDHRLIIRKYLDSKDKDWLSAYQLIPANIREMHVFAYQSYLWNECIKSLLFKFVDKKKLNTVAYNAGTLMYCKEISADEKKKLPVNFKLISHNGEFTTLEIETIDFVLKREKLRLGEFNISKTGNFFKSTERKVISNPKDLVYSFEVDEVNLGAEKMVIAFSLPKGSYATAVTKGIFNR